VVAINKYERRGAEDARRDVARQLVRNREAFGQSWEDMPVFGTSAARFDDDGVTARYHHLRDRLAEKGLPVDPGVRPRVTSPASAGLSSVVPATGSYCRAEIAEAVRASRGRTDELADSARRRQHLHTAAGELLAAGADPAATQAVEDLAEAAHAALD